MVEIHVRDWSGDAAPAIEAVTAELGLTIKTDGRLASYPGSRHWHLKNGRRSGTLEVTLWPDRDLLWVTYHSNRIGDGWVCQAAPAFARALADHLGGVTEPEETQDG